MRLKNVRLSFPQLFTAREFKVGDGKPRWSAVLLIKPGSENDKLIREAIDRESVVRWGDKAKATLAKCAGQSNKHCYLDGNLVGRAETKDMMVLHVYRAAKTKAGDAQPPLVVDTDGKSRLGPSSGRPYAGCYVNAEVEIYCQSGENTGVRGSFTAVQYAGAGEAFGSNNPEDTSFDDLGNVGDGDPDLF